MHCSTLWRANHYYTDSTKNVVYVKCIYQNVYFHSGFFLWCNEVNQFIPFFSFFKECAIKHFLPDESMRRRASNSVLVLHDKTQQSNIWISHCCDTTTVISLKKVKWSRTFCFETFRFYLLSEVQTASSQRAVMWGSLDGATLLKFWSVRGAYFQRRITGSI